MLGLTWSCATAGRISVRRKSGSKELPPQENTSPSPALPLLARKSSTSSLDFYYSATDKLFAEG